MYKCAIITNLYHSSTSLLIHGALESKYESDCILNINAGNYLGPLVYFQNIRNSIYSNFWEKCNVR